MTIKYINDDLLDMLESNRIQVLIHGCNCFNTMGAGIAAAIRRAYPQAYEADLQTTKGERKKLGTYSLAQVGTEDNQKFIVNAYTQYTYNGFQDNFEYSFFEQVLRDIQADKRFTDKAIGMPLIGCGLAGGNPEVIIPMIKKVFADDPRTIYVVELSGNVFQQHKRFFEI